MSSPSRGWPTCAGTAVTPLTYLTGKSVAKRFRDDYSDAELREVATPVERLTAQADEVHVLFNNNHGDHAPRAAECFRRLLGQEVASLPPPQAKVSPPAARPPKIPLSRLPRRGREQQTFFEL